MALNSLFKLDPTRFSSMPSAGSFSRVVNTGPKQLTAEDLLGDLKEPVIPSADQLPKVNPLGEDVAPFMQLFMPAKGAHDSSVAALARGGYQSSWLDNIDAANYYLNYAPRGSQLYRDAQYITSVQNSYSPYRSTYNNNIAQYPTYQGKVDTYNKEVAAYKAVVDPLQKEIDTYNTEKNKRAGEYNTALVNPDRVDKSRTETQGEQLAATDLYSDNLHNLMLDRISSQPVLDQISALFSKGNK